MANPSTLFTRELVERLAECQTQMNQIHENLRHTQGYSHAIPASTINTWRIVKERLDHLYEFCLVAKTSVEKILPSSGVDSSIGRLEWTLRGAVYQMASVDDEINARGNLSISTSDAMPDDGERSHEQERWSRLTHSDFWGHWKPSPQAKAYYAIYKLQERIRVEGGSTPDVFGEVLSEDDLWAGDMDFVRHMTQVTSSTWCAAGP